MKLFGWLIIVLVVGSCIKAPQEEPYAEPKTSSSEKLLVLNEGLYQQNNTELSLIHINDSTIQHNYFHHLSGNSLGDTGNDMKIYGDKIYIVVYSSSKIEVLSKDSLKHIASIPMFHNDKARGPRSLAFHQNHIWVTTYDGYAVAYDTIGFNKIHDVKVGRNPEGIALANNKLFVANSGGLDSPNYDNTVSIIDLDDLEVRTIEVAINLSSVLAFNDVVYVNSRGDYHDVQSHLYQIDAVSEDVMQSYVFGATHLELKGDTLVVGHYNYALNTSHISYHDAVTGDYILDNALDISHIKTLFGVSVLDNGQIVCCDANNFAGNGTITVYENQEFKSNYGVGLLPLEVLLVK